MTKFVNFKKEGKKLMFPVQHIRSLEVATLYSPQVKKLNELRGQQLSLDLWDKSDYRAHGCPCTLERVTSKYRADTHKQRPLQGLEPGEGSLDRD